MTKEYDNWWLEGENGDQDMEDSHQEGWRNVIRILDKEDIANQTVLDFGCNQGGFLRTLYDQIPFKRATGIDLAKKAIEVAKSRVGNYPVEYFQTSDICSLNQKFNTVISTSVLYLIDDLDEHFSSIAKVLDEKGVYYASFTDQTNNPSFDYMKEKIDKYGATKMQNKTLTEVVRKLEEYGFAVELRKEHTEPVYHVSGFSDFYLSVEDYIQAANESYLIKSVKKSK